MKLWDSRAGALRGLVAAVGLAAAGALPLFGEDAIIFTGIWVGQLKVMSQSLTLVVNIAPGAGAPLVTIDSPDQGVKGIPASGCVVEGAKIRVAIDSIQASYEGALSKDGGRIVGTWTQWPSSQALVLERRAQAPVQNRPQEPKPPFPYRTEELLLPGKAAGVSLAGTLVLPAGAGPFPAVVLVTGSGPQNRDEELLGHKPFLVIADYLARRGIASLRCDDRGMGGSKGEFATATTFDFADDAEAAFDYLASRPEARKGAVGIVGHSEGGLVAPIVAARNPGVAFVAMLAGPGIVGKDLLKIQGELIAKAQGLPAAEIAGAASINAELYAIAAGPGDEASVKAALEKAYLGWLKGKKGMKKAERRAAEEAAGEVVAPLVAPWTRAFLGLDPAPYLERLGMPVLAIWGERDLQVPPSANLPAVRAALGRGAPGGPSAKDEVLVLPGLNHLFQESATGNPADYGKIEMTFSPAALAALGDWILGL
jgi:uncharacterized protein